MTDHHIHFGQWHEIYYNPENVITAVKECGTNEVWCSSTSSEIYCKDSYDIRDNDILRQNAPTARQLYEAVRSEMHAAIETAGQIGVTIHPLYWVIPEVHFANAVNVAEAMSDLPYEGFKLHPRGNHWDLSDGRTAALADELFDYADNHKMMILIHCGIDDIERPTLFEPFIAHCQNVTVQLAHCRPVCQILYMLRTYPNTVCDTAFADSQDVNKIIDAGFANRLRYGSDFPITHYLSEHPQCDEDVTVERLMRFVHKVKICMRSCCIK